MKSNYEEKHKILNDPDLIELVESHKKISQALYYKNKEIVPREEDIKDNEYYLMDYYELTDLHHKYNIECKEYKTLTRLNDNIARRKKRVHERIELFTLLTNNIILLNNLSHYELYFCTFTIDEDHIKRYENNINNFLRYIKKVLNNLNASYIINTDFGDKNERLHAHGIIAIQKGIIESIECHNYIILPHDQNYNIGFYYLEQITNSEEDKERLTCYITKLTRHAFKESNKNIQIVYSKDYKQVINNAIQENKYILCELNKLKEWLSIHHESCFIKTLFNEENINSYITVVNDKIKYLNSLNYL